LQEGCRHLLSARGVAGVPRWLPASVSFDEARSLWSSTSWYGRWPRLFTMTKFQNK